MTVRRACVFTSVVVDGEMRACCSCSWCLSNSAEKRPNPAADQVRIRACGVRRASSSESVSVGQRRPGAGARACVYRRAFVCERIAPANRTRSKRSGAPRTHAPCTRIILYGRSRAPVRSLARTRYDDNACTAPASARAHARPNPRRRW